MKKKITIRIANSPQIREFQKLLFRIYCQHLKWHDPSKFPNEIFTDEYDHLSTFLTVYSGQRLIAGVRLVPDSEKGFPHEKMSGGSLSLIESSLIDERIKDAVKNVGRHKIMEATRFIGEPMIKGLHTYDLMKAVYWFGIYNEKKVYFMVIDMNTFLLLRKLCFPVVPIGIPVFCEGSWTIPAVILISDIISNLESSVRSYILDTGNLAGKWQI